MLTGRTKLTQDKTLQKRVLNAIKYRSI